MIVENLKTSLATEITLTSEGSFTREIIQGLLSTPKYLPSKYFYDQHGDHLFKQIMACREYYPTRCELEIFTTQTSKLAEMVMSAGNEFDLIELGAGDCTKTLHLLRELSLRKACFSYMPIDISCAIVDQLQAELPLKIPGLDVVGFNGEYFQMLKVAVSKSVRPKVLLFLGANLGNMPPAEAAGFSRQLRTYLRPGDLAIIGMDLKKDPSIVLAAYNDSEKITRDFNLNLLRRINRELDADFDLTQFVHFPVYDPASGACKSYLISSRWQTVSLQRSSNPVEICFKQGEEIFMEISQKYRLEEVDALAHQASFETVIQLMDSKGWFTDTLWKAI